MFQISLPTFAITTLAATLVPCATVQAQGTVVPPTATSTEGNSACYYPFLYDASRAQVVWQGPSVTTSVAVVKSINFRRDGTTANYPALSLASHTARVGHTSVTPATMSTTFATNITKAMTTLVSGKYSVPALPAPRPTPAPFAIKYPLSAPFIYTPSAGDLLLDWTTGTGAAQSKMDYQLDAITVASSGGFGVVRQFGSWGKFAGNDPATWTADAAKIIPGGSVDIRLGGFGQGYTSNLIAGMSDTTYAGIPLPFHLAVIGAPSNYLYTSLDVIVPVSLTQTTPGNWTANPTFALPNDNKLIGLKAFVQTYHLDSKANNLGLVSSTGLELTIGSPGPIGKMVGTDGANSTRGQVMGFLPVVQFE